MKFICASLLAMLIATPVYADVRSEIDKVNAAFD